MSYRYLLLYNACLIALDRNLAVNYSLNFQEIDIMIHHSLSTIHHSPFTIHHLP
ncbi:MAG: hypothetical protein LH613_13635 [Chamaesiphon sp.]|nr:hypothetical protein [Chamaesiphon sp.]